MVKRHKRLDFSKQFKTHLHWPIVVKKENETMKNKTLLLKNILCAAGIVLLMATSAQAQLVYSTDFSTPYNNNNGARVLGGATPDVVAEEWFGSSNGVGILNDDLSFANTAQNRYRGSGVWLDTAGWAAGLVTVEVDVANFVAGADTTIIFQAYAATGVDALNSVSLDLHGGFAAGSDPIATGTATISMLGAEQTVTADGTAVPFTFTFNGTDDFVGLTFVQVNIPAGTAFGSADLDNLTVTVSGSTGVLLGDVDLSGAVEFLDIAPFISVLANGPFQAEADCNEDGQVTFLDIASFIAILSGM